MGERRPIAKVISAGENSRGCGSCWPARPGTLCCWPRVRRAGRGTCATGVPGTDGAGRLGAGLTMPEARARRRDHERKHRPALRSRA